MRSVITAQIATMTYAQYISDFGETCLLEITRSRPLVNPVERLVAVMFRNACPAEQRLLKTVDAAVSRNCVFATTDAKIVNSTVVLMLVHDFE